MAGSYMHVVTNTGRLKSNERMVKSLETGGDMFEAVEELYGMIWYLAGELVPDKEDAEAVKEAVEDARKLYQDGLKLSEKLLRRG